MVAKRAKVSESIPKTENKIAEERRPKELLFPGMLSLGQRNGEMKVS